MVFLGVLLLIIALVAGVGVLTMQGNRGTTESLEFFGYNFDTSLAGAFLIGAVIGAIALAGLALLVSRLSGAARRRKLDKRAHELEAERAALVEQHQHELESHRQQAEADRTALVDRHRDDLTRYQQESDAKHQRELARVREDAEAERAALVREHEQQLEQERQAVRDAVDRALTKSKEATSSEATSNEATAAAGSSSATATANWNDRDRTGSDNTGSDNTDRDTIAADVAIGSAGYGDRSYADESSRSASDSGSAFAPGRHRSDDVDDVPSQDLPSQDLPSQDLPSQDVRRDDVHTPRTGFGGREQRTSVEGVPSIAPQQRAHGNGHTSWATNDESSAPELTDHEVRADETRETSGPKKLWQRVVEKVEGRRHD